MNSTNGTVVFPDILITTSAFCFIGTAIISVGNFIVLFAIYKNPGKNLRTPSSLLFTNLVVSDLLTGVLLGSLFSVDSLMDVFGRNSVILDIVIFILGGLLLFVNNLTITAVSFDRLIAVVKPFYHRSRVTTKKIKIIIAMIWLLSSFICLLPVFRVPHWVFLLFYSHSHFSVPLVFLTTIYLVIFRTLRIHRRRFLRNGTNNDDGSKMNTETQGNQNTRNRMERDHRLTVTIALVMIFFCLASFPFVVGVHLMAIIQNCQGCFSEFWRRTVTSMFYFAARCVILNPALDPFVLMWRMPKVRQAVRATLYRRFIPRPRFRIRQVAPLPTSISETT